MTPDAVTISVQVDEEMVRTWVKEHLSEGLCHVPTADLVEELKMRAEVEHTVIGPDPDNHWQLHTEGPEIEPVIDEEWGTGPCTILVVVN